MTVKVTFEFATVAEMSGFTIVPSDNLGAAAASIIEGINAMDVRVNERLEALRVRVERIDAVEDAVRAFVSGVPALIAQAVEDARNAGVSEEQLAGFDSLIERLGTETDALASAVASPAPAEPAPEPAEPVPTPDEPAPVEPAPDPNAGDASADQGQGVNEG